MPLSLPSLLGKPFLGGERQYYALSQSLEPYHPGVSGLGGQTFACQPIVAILANHQHQSSKWNSREVSQSYHHRTRIKYSTDDVLVAEPKFWPSFDQASKPLLSLTFGQWPK